MQQMFAIKAFLNLEEISRGSLVSDNPSFRLLLNQKPHDVNEKLYELELSADTTLHRT